MALATNYYRAGKVTHAQPLSKGLTSLGLKIGSLNTQNDVRVLHPDGSICHTQLTATIPSDGWYDLTAAAPYTGAAITPTWPTATSTLVIGDINYSNTVVNGVTYVATLPAYSSGFTKWINGPNMMEAWVLTRYVSQADASNHPTLDAIWFVQSFAGGGFRVALSTRNMRDNASMTQFTYGLTVAINGSTVKTGTYTQWAYSNWYQEWDVSMTPGKVLTYDLTHLKALGILPNYLAATRSNMSWDITSTDVNSVWSNGAATCAQAADIMGFGLMPPGQAGGGYHPDLTPVDAWAAEWSVFQDEYMFDAVIRNGLCSGSWSGHVVESSNGLTHYLDTTAVTGRSTQGCYFLLDASSDFHPNTLSGPAGASNPWGVADVSPGVPYSRGNTHAGWQPSGTEHPYGGEFDRAHIGLPQLLGYLLTGRLYLLWQMQFWTDFMILNCKPGFSNVIDGLEPTFNPSRIKTGATTGGRIWANQTITRDCGHMLTNYARTAVFTPDADPLQTYYRTCVQNQLDGFSEYVTDLSPNGGIGRFVFYEGQGGAFAWWRQSYIAYGVHQCDLLGFFTKGAWTQIRDRICYGVVAAMNWMFDHPGFHDWTNGQLLPIWSFNSYIDTVTPPPPFFSTWEDAFTYALIFYRPDPGDYPFRDVHPINGTTDAEGNVILQIAKHIGVPNTQRCLDWLLIDNFLTITGSGPTPGDLVTRFGYGITYDGLPAFATMTAFDGEAADVPSANNTALNIASRAVLVHQ